LDYKLKIPDDIEKTIAAFANTLGGIIILGVAEHKKHNTPIWPPTRGMSSTPGLRERIVQKAHNAIYPPVKISVSRVMDNELLPGKSIVIVRVDESRDAPHAVEYRKKIYIFERVDNTSDPHTLADIDRIQYLLHRRQSIEDQREEMVGKALECGKRLVFRFTEGRPLRWASVVPMYPWRDLWEPSYCFAVLQKTYEGETQRVPTGAVAILKNAHRLAVRYVSLLAGGHVFDIEPYTENDGLAPEDKTLEYKHIAGFFNHVLGFAKKMYTDPQRQEYPGPLSVCVGLDDVHDYAVLDYAKEFRGKRLLDIGYREHDIFTMEEFMTDNGTRRLTNRLKFGLDLPPDE
jgi:hypothetical protein